MSKSFALGGMAAATRMAQSDLTAGSPNAIDDGGEGARTIIPHDPEAAANADLDGTASSRSASALNDDPDGFLASERPRDGWHGICPQWRRLEVRRSFHRAGKCRGDRGFTGS